MITKEEAMRLKKGDRVFNLIWNEVWTVVAPYQEYKGGWLVEVMGKGGGYAGISDQRMSEWDLI